MAEQAGLAYIALWLVAILVAGYRIDRKETDSSERLFDAVVDAHRDSDG